ncbi:MAG TPA: malto-oligosyltrehalose synthase [Puia sp.]|uniref:malto-oligosyltrehalose synthase n=1 Tax=Puia sp. TaxID=2045100 RepID=UPI002CF22EAC|nr:malto-oligosyltrehalose synthase [Puia sp.]HVU96135.1 malto-oligosyltrehalose synthase [Puia sp.]
MFIPNSTYRVQLNDKFTLRDLEVILPYLHRLGIDAVYASPLTTASKGSQHGYDVTNPLVLSPEIGTEEDWQRLATSLRSFGMRWIQDIVPNHMAYSTSNPWMYEVLQRGRDSVFFGWFDIDNDPPAKPLGERLMMPILGSPLDECLQKRELSLQATPQGFAIRYFDTELPVNPDLADWIDKSGGPETINAQPGLLGQLLHRLPYILTHYRLADEHINYRRFFTVNSLIGLCMEKEAVFDGWHASLRHWMEQGRIDGLRVDHIDGLADPKAYLTRLRQVFGEECYIVVEKILHRDEPLRGDWPVQGTTGYEALADINQLLTDAAGSRQLLAFYREKVIDIPSYEGLVYQRKHNYLRRKMGGEWENLFNRLVALPQAGGKDPDRLKEALGVWMASFPTYRAYPDAEGVGATDSGMFSKALDRARQSEPELAAGLDLLALLGEQEQALPFLRRLMQFTGPLAAKGIEDTVFYVYNPYISHCEVGDSPALAGIPPEEFHRRMQVRRSKQPHSLNATTTHDTKRGEDARIRLNYLSAIPGEWIGAVTQWQQLNQPAPSPNDEYLIYQALLGAWPEDGRITNSFRERFATYLTKALREADTETHYTDVNEAYEGQCQAFVKAILQTGSPFLASFAPFAQSVIRRSSVYCLSQLLLKVTMPGIPDIYQGAELWETSLVDPDNRRPVDYALRISLLDELQKAEVGGHPPPKGTEKIFTLYRSLAVRNRLPKVFSEGDYLPLKTEGPLLAFIRHQDEDWVLVAVPLIRKDSPDAVSLTLPPEAPQQWTHAFTGEKLTAIENKLAWPPGQKPLILATAR